ncbi:MAG: hypothetical protein QNK05_15815 [Myxococcota bacterium]|nr:hypothetical protein [Myxococcota bacterium]
MSSVRGALAVLVALFSCENPGDTPVMTFDERCVVLRLDADPGSAQVLAIDVGGASYGFTDEGFGPATPFRLQASRLGSYLLYDPGQSYVTSDGDVLLRESDLLSDVLLIDDSFESPAEWDLDSTGPIDARRLRFRHRKSGRFLGPAGLVDTEKEAALLVAQDVSGCADFPEASLDATGRVTKTQFEDGTLFGFVDTHSHILSNFSFGGGGIFHGAPFHPLGIEHALPDCELYHGPEGRRDLFGFGFDNSNLPVGDFLGAVLFGETPDANHATDGWPTFTDWPSAPDSSTHQVQYYRWLERAYLSGMRLVVQHATSNQIICDLIAGLGAQEVRYSCNDMVAVDRIIEETYALEDYIDAQSGGPGRGWFRIVTSPAQARQEILEGNMAVILGIETSNLFDCFAVPSAEFPACTEQDVLDRLDHYHDLGVRAIFPVHKYDNAFSAGDGQKFFIELGNFIQTGHFLNFTPDCIDVPTVFDRGPSSFPGLIMPRDDFLSPPPNDTTGFAMNPIGTLVPFLPLFLDPPGTEEVCQNAGLTQLGAFLIDQMMRRGMILEIDHLPRRSYAEAFQMLQNADYPAAGTHGLNNDGALYALGGVSKTGFGTCRDAADPSRVADGFNDRIRLIEANGAYPAEGFGFDLNGFAGARGPRFGPDANCGSPQTDPVTYPFTSYAGDVVFEAPRVGNRSIDFNTEGMVHIGLVAELIEDVRGAGVSDAELEPLFRSAEGYIRMWEKAEARGQVLGP